MDRILIFLLKFVKYTMILMNQLKTINRQDFRKILLELKFKSNHWTKNKMLLKNTAIIIKNANLLFELKKTLIILLQKNNNDK